MDLDLNEEQQMLRDLARGVCGSYAGLDVVRAMEDDPIGYPAELWKQLGALDLIGLTLPVAFGGSEMGLVEAAVVYQELGRALAPTPHLVSAVLAGGALVAAGDGALKQRWLPPIASGEAVVSVAWLEPGGGFGPAGVQARAVVDGDELVIDGTKRHVAFAAAASRLLTLVRTGDGEGEVALVLVDPSLPGVELTQQMTIASDTQYEVRLDGVRVPRSEAVGGTDGGWATWSEVMADAVVLLAAQAVGGAQHALDITVQYAKDREQFDKPLGAFQAISHYLADAKTAVDGAELLVYEAAWARASGKDATALAPMAKLFACRTYRDVTAMAQQVFGGVGFTLEYDIQLYFRRAKQLQLSWWDDRYLEELVAASALD